EAAEGFVTVGACLSVDAYLRVYQARGTPVACWSSKRRHSMDFRLIASLLSKVADPRPRIIHTVT
uniref:hypothetical protein n=1 Tax=Umezakia ovalisporum TaxID=75695 RepID=UPI0039C5D87C